MSLPQASAPPRSDVFRSMQSLRLSATAEQLKICKTAILQKLQIL